MWRIASKKTNGGRDFCLEIVLERLQFNEPKKTTTGLIYQKYTPKRPNVFNLITEKIATDSFRSFSNDNKSRYIQILYRILSDWKLP